MPSSLYGLVQVERHGGHDAEDNYWYMRLHMDTSKSQSMASIAADIADQEASKIKYLNGMLSRSTQNSGDH